MFLKIQLLIKLQMQVSIAGNIRVCVLSNQPRVQILNVQHEPMSAFASGLASVHLPLFSPQEGLGVTNECDVKMQFNDSTSGK